MKVNRRKELFSHISDENWNDWRWQVKNRITTLEELKKYLTLTEEEDDPRILKEYRMAITPYYLSLIDPDDPYDPVRKQAIPTIYELDKYVGALEDPLRTGDSDAFPSRIRSGTAQHRTRAEGRHSSAAARVEESGSTPHRARGM